LLNAFNTKTLLINKYNKLINKKKEKKYKNTERSGKVIFIENIYHMATSIKCYFRVIVVLGLITRKSDGYTMKRGSYVVETSGSAKKMNHGNHVM
jgi:hypothetical protein